MTGTTVDTESPPSISRVETERESMRRSILLPVIAASLDTNSTLKRGVMNRLLFAVTNGSGADLSNITLGVDVQGHAHGSDSFSLAANTSAVISVAVGGYADLPDEVALTNSLVIAPNEGEQVRIVTHDSLPVGDDLLAVEILNEEFVRGAGGKARFVLHNTSSEEIEIVMARRNGTVASPEVRFKLLNKDGMVYSVAPVRQYTGAGGDHAYRTAQPWRESSRGRVSHAR